MTFALLSWDSYACLGSRWVALLGFQSEVPGATYVGTLGEHATGADALCTYVWVCTKGNDLQIS